MSEKKKRKIKKSFNYASDELCESCHNRTGQGLHSCPYKEEINNNSMTLCNCCEDCERECCQDI